MIEVTLLGTGDTTGTPTPNCHCETCTTARNSDVERTRFSVHIQNQTTAESLLVDVSPDFRTQFRRHDVALPDAAIITHIHFDHLDGLGNAYRLLDDFDVYAADETDPVTDETVAETIARKYDYLDPITVFGRPPATPFEAAGFDVTLHPVDHPPTLCYAVVVERDDATLAITSDTSYDIPTSTRSALTGADLLLVDAIAPAALAETHPVGGTHHTPDGVPRTFGDKHLTYEGATALADELDAETTRYVHASHYYPPEDAFDDPIAIDGETHVL